MSFNTTPFKPRPSPGQEGSTPFRSSSASKFRSSLVPASRRSPVRPVKSPTKLAKTPTGSRNIFDTTPARGESITPFSPDLPPEVSRLTPRLRKFARKSLSSGMSNITSSQPFDMRIPSPDPGLTGEALAKEIPEPELSGSAYADQFLAHKCPPNFDDLQRRQFFCILDLRRLKYAADEIFCQKDWRLNVHNFAREFEKSRSMVLLRYGLYQFKSVKPTGELLQKWRSANGIRPESDESGRRTPGSARPKRKAEEELTPKDSTLNASSPNKNKRRNVREADRHMEASTPFKANKRKTEVSEEENEAQPKKLAKSTPSAATSIFESILNKTQSAGTSPVKPSLQSPSPFSVSKPKGSQNLGSSTKVNPFQQNSGSLLFGSSKTINLDTPSPAAGPSESVFSSHKIGSTPTVNTGNIFSYLSESPGSSVSNDDDEDHETNSEPEHQSEEQGQSAAVSSGTNTPPVQNGAASFTGKVGDTPSIFGGPSKSSIQPAKGGLFDRITMGPDSQPVRASPSPDDKQESVKESLTASDKYTATPAKQPGNYTFNPATTPISFSQSSIGAPKASAMAAVGSSTKLMKSDVPEPKASTPIFPFGGQAAAGPKSDTPSLFGSSDSQKTKSAETPGSIFAPQKSSVGSTSIFGTASTSAAHSSFAKPEVPNAGLATPTTKQPISIFDKSTTANAGSSMPTAKQAISIFDTPTTTNAGSSTPSTKQPISIFDKPTAANAGPSTPSTSTKPAISIFDKPTTATLTTSETKSLDDKKALDTPIAKGKVNIFDSSFIADHGARTKALTDNLKPSHDVFSRSANPLFAGAKTHGDNSTGANSTFDQESKPNSNEKPPTANESNKENLGSGQEVKAPASTAPAASIFSIPAPVSTTLFGEKKLDNSGKSVPSFSSSTTGANGPIFSFSSQPSSNTNTQSSSAMFPAAATPNTSVSFGAPSSQVSQSGPKKLDFQFGNSGPSAGSGSFTFGQNSSVGSGFTFTAGADGKSINNPFAASQPGSQASAPVFGGNSSTPTPPSSFTFSFGQQQSSTPKATPNTQGKGLFGGPSHTNGAPIFSMATPDVSFTQAPQSQSSSSFMGSKAPGNVGIFGSLHATGGASTDGNSPFPAPSSIGTTPMGGTPEPEGAHEDGEEPRQAQISLTQGTPGEEDEVIIHEVRAKALKYIPVQQGQKEDDEPEPKSPWSTQGVGQLRVLKNKSTGAVRMLLRAEPRGHIALNKSVLPDVVYKVEKKTVHFAAAKDDGSGLETWVLQVKTPNSAQELAGVLEANKGSNKK